ncbi:hypothetical protein QYE76_023972 [Lolium multiflorum]|uniref:F-box domain-containing protein n=1 Tax=Lolium multiflorum TaxID=4521 RepID=A0AAD8VVA2_LOLMU|nr:hypothetical protein QYE76_023972 [Lolium multiflorum]
MAARTSSGVDRISHLPDSLLREIVYRLPAKDAARTALLAARWRGVWRSPAAPAPARWASTLAAAGAAMASAFRRAPRVQRRQVVCGGVARMATASSRGTAAWRAAAAPGTRAVAAHRRRATAPEKGREATGAAHYIPAPETGTGARAERSGAWTKAMVTAMDYCGVARFTATAWRGSRRRRGGLRASACVRMERGKFCPSS